MRWWLWLSVLWIAVGVCIFALTALAIVLGDDVDGVVTAIEYEMNDGGLIPQPVVEFRDPGAGKLIQRRITSPGFGRPVVGDRLSLKYWGVIGFLMTNNFSAKWVAPIVLCLVGLIHLFVYRRFGGPVLDK